MRVMFVYTDIGISVGYSCGIGVLSAYLKQHGHDTKLIHVSDELGYALELEKIVADMRAYDPGLIAFSAVTNQWYFVRQIAKYVRRHLKTPIVVGGHHANAVPFDVLAESAVDYACKGEGEQPLLELVNRLEQGLSTDEIPNIATKARWGQGLTRKAGSDSHHTERGAAWVGAGASPKAELISIGVRESKARVDSTHSEAHDSHGAAGTGIIDNAMGHWVQDLDELPFEDRDVFQYDEIVQGRHGWAEVIASRGCPYACTYCFNLPFFSRYKNDLKGTADPVTMKDYVRRRSVDSTIGMLKEVKEKYPHVKFFTFVDDVFAIYSRWLADLAPRYAKEIGLPFAATSQPLAFNETIARLLKEMGCKVVKMGVEAGNERIRNQVLNRNIPDKVLIEGFALARKYGLKPQAFNMIGLPSETKENMLETVRLNAKLRAYIVWMSTFMPYPGTVLNDYCISNDLIDPERWDDVRSYHGGSVLKEGSFTHVELEGMRVLFKWHLNVALENECSDEYRRNVEELEALSKDDWLSGRAEQIFNERDPELDQKYRAREVDHYITKKYVNMFWAKEYGFDIS